MPRFMLRTFLVAIGFATFGSHARAADEPLTLYFKAAVTIEPDGTLSRLEWADGGKIPAPLRDRLDARVHGWTFEPGTVDGVPAQTRSTLHVRLEAEAADGGLSVRVEDAETGPLVTPAVPPQYPREALRRGHEAMVLAVFEVAPDGRREMRVEAYEGDEASRKRFEDATRSMLPGLEVQPEEVGGRMATAQVRMPVEFCIDACPETFEVARRTSTDTGSAAAPGEPEAIASVARIVTDIQGTIL